MNKNALSPPNGDQERASRSTQANQLAESLLVGLSNLKTVSTEQEAEQAKAHLVEISQQITEFGPDDIIKAIDRELGQTHQNFLGQRIRMSIELTNRVISAAESTTIDMGTMGGGWKSLSATDAVEMVQGYPMKLASSQRRKATGEHLDKYFGESRQLGDSIIERTNKLSAAKGLVQGLALLSPQPEK